MFSRKKNKKIIKKKSYTFFLGSLLIHSCKQSLLLTREKLQGQEFQARLLLLKQMHIELKGVHIDWKPEKLNTHTHATSGFLSFDPPAPTEAAFYVCVSVVLSSCLHADTQLTAMQM